MAKHWTFLLSYEFSPQSGKSMEYKLYAWNLKS